jgi:hypothetical protein
LVFNSLDTLELEKVPGTIKKSEGARKKRRVKTKNVREKGAALILILRRHQVPSFRVVLKTSVRINPEQPPGFRPGKVEGLIFGFWVFRC